MTQEVVPAMAQGQVPSAPRVQKIVEMPEVQFSDGEVDMPVVTTSGAPERAEDCGGAADPVR